MDLGIQILTPALPDDPLEARQEHQVEGVRPPWKYFDDALPKVVHQLSRTLQREPTILVQDGPQKIPLDSQPPQPVILFLDLFGRRIKAHAVIFTLSSLFSLDIHLLFTHNAGNGRLEFIMPLTKRQQEILKFIESYLETRGYSPSMEEIADHFGIASLNAIYKHLRVLQERGFIRRLSNRARSIQVVHEDLGEAHAIPLLGRIAAGLPIEAIATHEEIQVPQSLLTRGQNYVLQVEGDSMIDEHIQDGDLIVVEQRESARDGETIVALIDGERATLKKVFREGSRVRLQPANPTLEPILVPADRLQIQGVVVGLIRKY